MQISTTISGLSQLLDFERNNNQQIGFVPTMGALHKGHLSLVDKAFKENDVVVASIFVNPTQFNDPNDLKKYPRMPEADLALLNKAGCHYVFMPDISEIYKPGEPLLDLDLGFLETTMEGYYRPGHFKGVATVVDKLFRIVRPTKAYFGEKDFQQLAVIRRMAVLLNHTVSIVGCPTLRENNGLAMSSRNLLLAAEERIAAPLIYKTIKAAGNLLKNKEPFSKVKAWVKNTIDDNPFLKVQYFDIVHPDTLVSINDNEVVKEAQGCIAVLTAGPRLIDNVGYQF